MKRLFLPLLLAALMLSMIAGYATVIQATLTTDTDTGSVEYKVPGAADFKKLTFKDEVTVPVGTQIKTDKNGVAKLMIFPGSKIVISPNSTITVSSANVDSQGDMITKRQAEINLSAGALKALLNHKVANDSPIDFKVQAPTCVAAAKGTKYIVAIYDGVVYIDVMEGTVTAGDLILTAGEIGAYAPTGTGAPSPGKLVTPGDIPPGALDLLNGTATGNVTTVDTGDNQGPVYLPDVTSGRH